MAPAKKKPSADAGGGKAKGGKAGGSSTPSDDKKASGGGAAGKLKPATAINVRHILCTKQSRKDDAVAQLQAGAKFDDVARALSEDKARQGGSLGWKTRGSSLPEFEKVAYALEPSTTGKPRWAEVKTGEGWHVVMVEGRR